MLGINTRVYVKLNFFYDQIRYDVINEAGNCATILNEYRDKSNKKIESVA